MNEPICIVDERTLDDETEEDNLRINTALAMGVRAALRRHKQNGQSVVVWEDGKVKWVAPEDIVVPEDDSDLLAALPPREPAKNGSQS